MTIRELRQKRAKLWEDMKALNETAKNEKRSMNEDELKQWKAMDADIEKVDSEIQVEERNRELASQMAEKKEEVKEEAKRTRDDIFKDYARRGLSGLKSGDRSILEQRGTNTQITTTDGLGGYLVPDIWAANIMESMKWYASVLDIANVITSGQGGTFRVPANDDTSVSGSIIGQGVADTVNDLTFTELTIDEYTYTSGLIKASWEMLNDSAYDLAGYIQKKAGERIGRVWENHFTTGTGSSQPYGFVTGATEGKVATANNAITSDEILDLIFSLDKAYRGRGVLVMHDSTLKAIRQLSIGASDDRPLWAPSIRDGEPSTIHGVPYVINNAMAELTDGVNSKVMAFGDFSYYTVRLVKGIEMVRLNERFADSRSAGFFAWARAGARLTNTAAVKYLALAAA